MPSDTSRALHSQRTSCTLHAASSTLTTREAEVESNDTEELCNRRALNSGSPPSQNAVEKNTLLESILLFFSVKCVSTLSGRKGEGFVSGRQKGLHFRRNCSAVSPLYDCCTMLRKSRGRVGDDPTKNTKRRYIYFDVHALFAFRRCQALV